MRPQNPYFPPVTKQQRSKPGTNSRAVQQNISQKLQVDRAGVRNMRNFLHFRFGTLSTYLIPCLSLWKCSEFQHKTVGDLSAVSTQQNSWKLFFKLRNTVALQGQVFYFLYQPQTFRSFLHTFLCVRTIMQSSDFVGPDLVNLGRELCISIIMAFHLWFPYFTQEANLTNPRVKLEPVKVLSRLLCPGKQELFY